MYRTVKTTFRANQQTLQELMTITQICGQIWNDCLELERYYYRLGNAWITKTQLQQELKQHYPLHSQTIQAVAHKYLDARDATTAARKQGLSNRYPWRKKTFFNPKWVDKAFTLQGNQLSLSLGNTKGLDGKKKPPLQLRLKQVPVGIVKEVELIYDRGFKICLSYDNGIEEKENPNQQIVANDIGEIHTVAAVSENGESLLISGRYLRSIHRLRNKKLASLQKRLRHCKKGSRQWKKYQKAKQYVLSKSEAQLQDALHKTTKQFVDWCVQQQTKTILTGDVDGVQRHTKKKRSKKTNQKLSNWSFGKFTNYLTYKAKVEGIDVQKVNEAYTSQTCPVCTNRKKVKGRTYRCRCGYQKHRDIHGACNILTNYRTGRFTAIESQDPMYLRPV